MTPPTCQRGPTHSLCVCVCAQHAGLSLRLQHHQNVVLDHKTTVFILNLKPKIQLKAASIQQAVKLFNQQERASALLTWRVSAHDWDVCCCQLCGG